MDYAPRITARISAARMVLDLSDLAIEVLEKDAKAFWVAWHTAGGNGGAPEHGDIAFDGRGHDGGIASPSIPDSGLELITGEIVLGEEDSKASYSGPWTAIYTTCKDSAPATRYTSAEMGSY